METRNLSLGQCLQVRSQPVECGVLGDDRRECVGPRTLIVANEDGLVDPCAEGRIWAGRGRHHRIVQESGIAQTPSSTGVVGQCGASRGRLSGEASAAEPEFGGALEHEGQEGGVDGQAEDAGGEGHYAAGDAHGGYGDQ